MDYTVNLRGDTIAPIPSLPFSALGGQPGFDRDALDEFLSGNHIANLAYLRKDGRPNQAPLWYRYADGVMVFAVSTDSAKHRALLRDDRVCVTVQDERPPYRAVIIDGTVELVDIGTAGELSTEMATRYFGKLGANEYEKISRADRESKGQTLIRLIPSEVKGFDNTKAINKALLTFTRVRDKLPIPRRWV
ncbi:PPOX class F420-dependent oxidoreductase [Ilumatobacter nonamiensis]|uniref:PPOX class F420-dependent oxidoreductase n=1 Tax=Ilumatobacter nonamiensis TaxID=467093 RepID=UPI000348615E|nr:PPOX class F420-dependent oxidoreductase [Ilumatobacter nonamiensis]